MTPEEAVAYLQAYLEKPTEPKLPATREGATVVTCVDGRLNPYLGSFRFVIRTAGAAAEAVEGSVGFTGEASGFSVLATHGDCLANRAGIDYLSASRSGAKPSGSAVAHLNRSDTRAVLTNINHEWRLDRLPASDDQRALARLGINYARRWTAGNPGGKPRVGLFIDLASVVAPQPRVWVVSYDGMAGAELVSFLRRRGMREETVSQNVLVQEPVGVKR
ncbi:MAG: hypothetical protein FJ320_05170 [SAR202 cluster bacterium]|nr:hypothetical protein [SAR202 cluster bacterium]